MPQCQFPVSCCFCVSEKLHRKYSRNWTKQKPKSLITWHEDGVQRRGGGGPEASHTIWWRGLGPGHNTRGCDCLVHPLTSPFRLYILLDEKTLRAQTIFLENILQAAAVVDARSGGPRSSSRHPVGEGNYHRRPSSSPCPHLEWCVISLP
jgi:hypothetical protein